MFDIYQIALVTFTFEYIFTFNKFFAVRCKREEMKDLVSILVHFFVVFFVNAFGHINVLVFMQICIIFLQYYSLTT